MFTVKPSLLGSGPVLPRWIIPAPDLFKLNDFSVTSKQMP